MRSIPAQTIRLRQQDPPDQVPRPVRGALQLRPGRPVDTHIHLQPTVPRGPTRGIQDRLRLH